MTAAHHKALVCALRNIRTHPNADRLKLATVSGHQIIVGLDRREGDVGVFFGPDLALSDEMCRANSLYRKDPDTGEAMGGYFEANRRVRAVKLRGARSEGFWTPLDSLAFTGDVSALSEGDRLDSLHGVPLCEKYVPQHIRNQQRPGQPKARKRDAEFPLFAKHYDTPKLRHCLAELKPGDVLHVTEKIHGTSGRTGLLPRVTDRPWYLRAWDWLRGVDSERWEYVSGTRNVVMDPDSTEDGGFYAGKRFRHTIHGRIKAAGLRQGETLYYEIAGFAEDGTRIMPAHPTKGVKEAKRYGERVAYTYGCALNQCRVFVYRITQTTSDGSVIELSPSQVADRASALGLEPVPYLDTLLWTEDDGHSPESALSHMVSLTEGSSELDPTHPMEGIAIRVGDRCYKLKSWVFTQLEGIAFGLDDYRDPEMEDAA